MSVVYNRKSRRQFLVGTGNTLLALPFLPSLFSSTAEAQAAAGNSNRLMLFVSDHPMLNEYWLSPTLATTTLNSFGTKSLSLKSLSSISDVSPMLTNPIFNALRVNDKMTVIRGTEMQAGVGHENYSGLGGSNGECPTFDTIVEDSPTIYDTNTASYVTKAIRFDQGPNHLSYRKVGNAFQDVLPYGFDGNYGYGLKFNSITTMYNDVFKSLTNGTALPPDTSNVLKTNILNRVYESYRSFKSNRRISSDDIARVDQHMGFLADLQRSLANFSQPPPTCAKPTEPVASYDPKIFTATYIDLMTVALKCGLTKVAVAKFDADSTWLPGLTLPEGTGLHGAIHGGNTPDLWALKRYAHTSYDIYNYNFSIARFLNSMNEAEGDTGRTYLDNMITAALPKFTMEAADGGSGHGGYDCQTTFFGTMGGRMKAGNYLSFPQGDGARLPHNSVFVTLLDLMGVPPSEYTKYSNTTKGWGIYQSSAGNPFASRFYNNVTELML